LTGKLPRQFISAYFSGTASSQTKLSHPSPFPTDCCAPADEASARIQDLSAAIACKFGDNDDCKIVYPVSRYTLQSCPGLAFSFSTCSFSLAPPLNEKAVRHTSNEF
jgi:hypothetical protein